jgi:hypothetical protein
MCRSPFSLAPATQASVGGQLSSAYAANMSYAPPNVASYDVAWEQGELVTSTGANTRGGQWVVIQGRDFGSAAENRVDRVEYRVATSSSTAFEETYVPCQSAMDPSTNRLTTNK